MSNARSSPGSWMHVSRPPMLSASTAMQARFNTVGPPRSGLVSRAPRRAHVPRLPDPRRRGARRSGVPAHRPKAERGGSSWRRWSSGGDRRVRSPRRSRRSDRVRAQHGNSSFRRSTRSLRASCSAIRSRAAGCRGRSTRTSAGLRETTSCEWSAAIAEVIVDCVNTATGFVPGRLRRRREGPRVDRDDASIPKAPPTSKRSFSRRACRSSSSTSGCSIARRPSTAPPCT